MFKLKSLLHILALGICCTNVLAIDKTELTIEEQRIEKAQQLMPDVVKRLKSTVEAFQTQILTAKNAATLNKIIPT